LFTVAQRDEFSGRVVELAQADARIVAGAVVGSFAIGAGDRYSDVDLTFAVADEVTTVLEDWTRLLVERFEGVPLVDLERPPTIYRVFLLPAALQFDLSMTPAALFRPAGPKFRLLFGETVPDPVDGGQQSVGDLFISTPAATSDIFGWGVIYALHARACIERGRVWQAEHYVGALRDHALALACLREGAPVSQGRGYDELSAETLERFASSHVPATEPDSLRVALAATISALLDEGVDAGLAHAPVVSERLVELR
jgi:hypothetical protein